MISALIILSAGHAHGQVEQTPRLVTLAGASEDHLAALVQEPLNNLRRRLRCRLDQLPEIQDFRQRRRHHPQVNRNVNLLAHQSGNFQVFPFQLKCAKLCS